MKYAAIFLIISSFFTGELGAQSQQNSASALWESLSDSYASYRYDAISDRRFKHEDIMLRLSQLDASFTVKTVGQSNEGRALKLVSIGKGPIDIFLWSQMHGNEPTATMALMDVMNWLGGNEDDFQLDREELFSKVTIHMLPMLNPDGAARFRRRNTQAIDINRDALRLQSPEGRTLKRVRDSLDADWGFNLHDQGRATSVDQKPATLSFLAPAYDFERSVNSKRGDAMKLIAQLNAQLQKEIPDQVGRYWDDFEPRAFGDNIQKWGTRTILIESGGQYGDREKQEIRKLNYVSLQLAFWSIGSGGFQNFRLDQYEEIPTNSRGIRDVIVRNVSLPSSMGGYLIDMAMNFQEIEASDYESFYLSANVVDVGDLSTSGAYIVYDMNGYSVTPALKKEESFTSMDDLLNSQLELIKTGIAFADVLNPNYFERNLLLQLNSPPSSEIAIGQNPSLVFSKEGEIRLVLINGFLIDVTAPINEIMIERNKL